MSKIVIADLLSKITSERSLPNVFSCKVAFECLSKLKVALPQYHTILDVITTILQYCVYKDPLVEEANDKMTYFKQYQALGEVCDHVHPSTL